jgi:hypothetical protein
MLFQVALCVGENARGRYVLRALAKGRRGRGVGADVKISSIEGGRRGATIALLCVVVIGRLAGTAFSCLCRLRLAR